MTKMKNAFKKGMLFYLVFTGFNYFLYYSSIINNYSFVSATILILFTSSYFWSGVLALRGKKIGYLILTIILALSVFVVDSQYFSFNVSTILDVLLYYREGEGLGIDFNLGGRFAIAFYESNPSYKFMFGIDIVPAFLMYYSYKEWSKMEIEPPSIASE